MPRDNSVPAKFNRELNMTEPEESVLVQMASYFLDMGWIDDDTEEAFDSLVEKICEPAPWDYSIDPQSIKQ
tara:strand:- start:1029 stop:1241 length:213 start_codon:yes stop_codon:yes gene_type:complete